MMSAPSKAVELQLQMKQNAEELQDFMRELKSWEKDIKEVDSELRKQSGVPEEVKTQDQCQVSYSYRDSVYNNYVLC